MYAQILMGDVTDNIPGLDGMGPSKTAKVLAGAESEGELYALTLEAYRAVHGEDAEGALEEQARLVFMVRELDENGNPVMWRKPE